MLLGWSGLASTNSEFQKLLLRPAGCGSSGNTVPALGQFLAFASETGLSIACILSSRTERLLQAVVLPACTGCPRTAVEACALRYGRLGTTASTKTSCWTPFHSQPSFGKQIPALSRISLVTHSCRRESNRPSISLPLLPFLLVSSSTARCAPRARSLPGSYWPS